MVNMLIPLHTISVLIIQLKFLSINHCVFEMKWISQDYSSNSVEFNWISSVQTTLLSDENKEITFPHGNGASLHAHKHAGVMIKQSQLSGTAALWSQRWLCGPLVRHTRHCVCVHARVPALETALYQHAETVPVRRRGPTSLEYMTDSSWMQLY